jgi:hypothetical protein
MSKAIVLPINILVIVAIATVVTLGLASIYGVGYNPFSSAMTLESVKNIACRQLVFGGCKKNTTEITVNYDANRDTKIDSNDTLFILCNNFFGRKDEKSCKQLCGCAGAITGGPTGPKGNFTISLTSYSGTLPPDSGALPIGLQVIGNWIGVSSPPSSLNIQYSNPDPATIFVWMPVAICDFIGSSCKLGVQISTLSASPGTYNIVFSTSYLGESHSATFKLTVSGGSACSCDWVLKGCGSAISICFSLPGPTWYNYYQCECTSTPCSDTCSAPNIQEWLAPGFGGDGSQGDYGCDISTTC